MLLVRRTHSLAGCRRGPAACEVRPEHSGSLCGKDAEVHRPGACALRLQHTAGLAQKPLGERLKNAIGLVQIFSWPPEAERGPGGAPFTRRGVSVLGAPCDTSLQEEASPSGFLKE